MAGAARDFPPKTLENRRPGGFLFLRFFARTSLEVDILSSAKKSETSAESPEPHRPSNSIQKASKSRT
jgi:hypothetical protein